MSLSQATRLTETPARSLRRGQAAANLLARHPREAHIESEAIVVEARGGFRRYATSYVLNRWSMPGMCHPNGPFKTSSAHRWGVLLLAALWAVAGCDRSTADPTTEGNARSKREIPAGLPADIAADVELLCSEDAVERARGASRLGALGRAGAPAVPFLIDALVDPHWQVRQQSAEALGSIGDEQAAVPLIAVLTDRDGDWGARAAAARALGALKSPEAVEPLALVLNDTSAHVRQMAVISLGEIGLGTEKATAALETAARSDPDAAVRFSAAESLRRIGQPR